jgi:arylsulfatase A-like enzyme
MKNIVLFSIDNLRYDCVGYQPDKAELIKYQSFHLLDTTYFDLIADKSLCFSKCYSTNTYTTSAHASLLTGLYPPGHGARAFYDTRISREVFPLAEILKVYGYETVLLSDVPVLFEPLGLDRGFDHVLSNNEDEKLFELLRKFRNDNKKVFLLVHVFDVHEPYLLSESPMSGEYNNDYFDVMKMMYELYGVPAVEKCDPHTLYFHLTKTIENRKNKKDWLPVYVRGVTKYFNGRFRVFIDAFEQLNYFDDSMFFIFSDHGEGRITAESPESFSHGGLLYENVLRIPMIVYKPDGSHCVDDRLTSIVDICPSVLETVTGRPCTEILPYNVDGTNLFISREREYIYCEKWFCKPSPIKLDNTENKWTITQGLYKEVESFLEQRCFINEDEKVLLLGRPEEIIFNNADLLRLTPSNFVDRLFKDILVRKARASSMRYWVDRAENIVKQTVIEEFIESLKKENKVSCEYYHVNNVGKKIVGFTITELRDLVNGKKASDQKYDGILHDVKKALLGTVEIEEKSRTGEAVFLPGQPIYSTENIRYITLLSNPTTMESNRIYELDIVLRNISNVLWTSSNGDDLGGPIMLSYHWHKVKVNSVYNGLRTELSCNLNPGEAVEMKAKVQAPPEPGKNILEFDMVIENVNWLKNFGFPTTILEIEIL